MEIKTKALILSIIVGVIIFISISFVNAESQTLGVVKQGDSIQLIQSCTNSTYSNITMILYPNKTFALNSITPMTKSGNNYNYSFSNTNTLGNYMVYGNCNENGVNTEWVYDFEVTYNQQQLDTPKAILFLGLIAILILLFILIVINIPRLPSKDDTDEEGNLISINQLKYLRPVFYGIAWLLLLAVIFITSNISLAYLPENMFGNFFFTLYTIMMYVTYPMLIVWFIYMFVRIFQDRKIKKIIERGVEMKSSW